MLHRGILVYLNQFGQALFPDGELGVFPLHLEFLISISSGVNKLSLSILHRLKDHGLQLLINGDAIFYRLNDVGGNIGYCLAAGHDLGFTLFAFQGVGGAV